MVVRRPPISCFLPAGVPSSILDPPTPSLYNSPDCKSITYGVFVNAKCLLWSCISDKRKMVKSTCCWSTALKLSVAPARPKCEFLSFWMPHRNPHYRCWTYVARIQPTRKLKSSPPDAFPPTADNTTSAEPCIGKAIASLGLIYVADDVHQLFNLLGHLQATPD